MPHLLFTQDREVLGPTTHDGSPREVLETYKAGLTYHFRNAASARHWLNRQCCEEVATPGPAPKPVIKVVDKADEKS